MAHHQMNRDTRMRLRNEILETCSQETMSMGQLVEQFDHIVEHYGSGQFKKLVYGLEITGLLFGTGSQRGRVYRTTADGGKLL